MPCLSRIACQLSVLKLMGEGFMELDASFCYLHTLTFADPEPTISEAMRRFDNLRRFFARSGKRGVRVIQLGDATGRVHFHLVTRERWSSREMWRVLPSYGFGRYDVRLRPSRVAFYAARYVGRWSKFRLPRGTRAWAAFGFDGVRVTDVLVKRKVLTIVAEEPRSLRDYLVWCVPSYNLEITLKLRLDAPPGSPLIQMNEVKPAQAKHVMEILLKGAVGAVGEYRSTIVRSIEYADKKNPSGPKIRRVVAEHNVELAGEAVLVSEWLPVGTAENTVKNPASRGDSVFVVAEQFTSTFGRDKKISGKIVALGTLL